LPADTKNTFILSLDHSWTALCSHKNQRMHQTRPMKRA